MNTEFDLVKIVQKKESGVVVLTYVQPGAHKTELQGLFGEPPRLKLRVAAPPVDGAANEEVVRFFAKLLKTKNCELYRGHKQRKKDVIIFGLDVESVCTKILQQLQVTGKA